MTGSILQLVAYGIEDIFLTSDPQITYFKIVYKRHTNFSREEIRQNFSQRPDFGSQVSAVISRNGDLMEKSYIVITLPEIKKSTDGITRYAWVKNIGYSIIDSVSIEINNRQICKHFGEWMFLWNEMFNYKANEESFRKMIGDIPELTDYTFYKNSYKLYVPLQFWFCRNSANALPLVSLEYSDIKINLSIKDWDECLITSPSHYIVCSENLVNFENYEYIEQDVEGVMSAGVFIDFDPYNKRLYYSLLTKNNFLPVPETAVTVNNQNKYRIYGKSFNSYATPAMQTKLSTSPNSTVNIINPSTYKSNSKIKVLSLEETYLLINYIFIDDDERLRFAQSKHDYIIEQIYFTQYNEIIGPIETVRLNIDNPCRYIIWLLQQKYLYDAKDYYNYIASYRNKRTYDTYEENIKVGEPLYTFENSLIKNTTILCNEKERISYRDSKYFRYNQIYEKCINKPPAGVNAYFFTLDPNAVQHMGAYNMSRVEKIEIKMKTNSILSANNIGLFRCYAESYNILRIANGLGALLFER